MGIRAGLFSDLVYRMNAAAEIADLGKFPLYRLQPFLPSTVSDLSVCSIPFSKAIVQWVALECYLADEAKKIINRIRMVPTKTTVNQNPQSNLRFFGMSQT
jgi:hypothetical protein